jgi:hypothetical protein
LVKLPAKIVRKSMKMNRLRNKQRQSGQTMLNLVKDGQNEPIRFGFRAVRRCRGPGFPRFRALDTGIVGVRPSPAAASHEFFERAGESVLCHAFHTAAPGDRRTPTPLFRRTPVALPSAPPVSGPKIWACAGRGNGYISVPRANGFRGGFVFQPID